MTYIYSLINTLPNKKILIKVHQMQELLQEPFKSHRRLRVFAEKGLKCAYYGKLGIHLITAYDKKDKGKYSHTDVYTEFMELMTVDHMRPLSKGGTWDIENLVPCCQTCNSRKSNKLILTNEQNTREVTL